MPIIMTIDCECDMIENNLSMIQLINEEKIRKANEIVVYGRSLPNEVWNLIKEFNNWTDKERERRIRETDTDTNHDYIHLSYSYDKKMSRAGRIAPPVNIGDEVCDGFSICGRVVKINKKSIDIERYAFITYQKEIVLGDGFGGKILIDSKTTTYKWKRDIFIHKRGLTGIYHRLIGSYQLGDNGGGFEISGRVGFYRLKIEDVYSDSDYNCKNSVLPTKMFYWGLWKLI